MNQPRDIRLHKAVRILKAHSPAEFALLDGWLRDALRANRAAVSATLEPFPLHRLLGEQYALSAILDEFDEAPAREAAAANGAPGRDSPPRTPWTAATHPPGAGIPGA